MKSIISFITLLMLLVVPSVFAFDVTPVNDPVTYIKITLGIIALLSIYIIFIRKEYSEIEKKILFYSFSVPVLLATLYLAGFTVTENIHSVTNGPVHWHAEYEVWYCGEELDLVDPKFPKNKVGSPLFHEHDDHWIHVEGTVMNLEDVNFGAYFAVVGGALEPGYLKYPTNESTVLEARDGDLCNGVPSSLRVFVNGERIDNYHTYEIYPDAYVPPGDCIIVEFGPDDGAQTTDKICLAWEAKSIGYENMTRDERQVGDTVWS